MGLSNTLTHLNCSSNPNIDLTNLPDSIEYLECELCKLLKLDILPFNIKFLNCAKNKKSSKKNTFNSFFIV